ncbi:MAG: hypothetical protein CMJ64_15635 [Planctomycetaceae bacterium]|nr:hypothetical protein [Planctomycetaceae bacterium]
MSSESGTVEFELSPTNSGDHRVRTDTSEVEHHGEASREVIDVPCEALDRLLDDLPSDFTDDVRLIWIVVQGHEGQAFLGARKVLSRGVPVVAEIWPYGVRRSGMFADEFCRLACDFWSEAWIVRHGRFDPSPVADLAQLFNVPDSRGRFYENVIFTGLSHAAVRSEERRVA